MTEKEGTIILDSDGSIFKVLESSYPCKGMIQVQFIDEDEPRYLSKIDTTHSTQFRSDAADLQFAIANAIHKRLNRLSKV